MALKKNERKTSAILQMKTEVTVNLRRLDPMLLKKYERIQLATDKTGVLVNIKRLNPTQLQKYNRKPLTIGQLNTDVTVSIKKLEPGELKKYQRKPLMTRQIKEEVVVSIKRLDLAQLKEYERKPSVSEPRPKILKLEKNGKLKIPTLSKAYISFAAQPMMTSTPNSDKRS